MGQFIIFLEGGGQDCIFWDKLKIFFVYAHTKNFFFFSKFWGGGRGGMAPKPKARSVFEYLFYFILGYKKLIPQKL